ncbi:MAG: MaoC/PaaZ C-terminal domain-containing protein [Dehalococcoidia bacterium]|mgnify:CR=1 FL=1|nr:MaoC/PaaZ C-terminal domain-containing protein [Dehalococcoidia bacterium]
MEQRYFEAVDIGDEYEQERTPTSEDVQTFLSLTGLGRPGSEARSDGRRGGPGDGRFESAEGAASVGLAAPILPGNMSFAMMSRLVTDWAGVGGHMLSLDVSFRRPVHHNDVLTLQVLVTDTVDDDAQVKLDIYMENERGERPVQGTALVELPRRE